jgi:hypothetical protein
MKKLFFSAAIAMMIGLTASAQKFDPKQIDAKSTKTKAAASLKSRAANKGASAFTSADDCGAFTKTETDKDGASYQSAKDFLIVSNDGTTGFGFTMSSFMLEGDKYVMLVGVALEKGFCVAKSSSKIVITFEDETQVSFTNFQADNCEGVVKTYIGKKVGNEADVEKIRTKKVRSIKLVGVEKSIVKPLSENNQIQLQGTVKCL